MYFKQLIHYQNSDYGLRQANMGYLNCTNDMLAVHFYANMVMDIQIDNIKTGTLLDTGSDRSVISQKLMQKLGKKWILLPPEVQIFKLASGQILKAKNAVFLTFRAAQTDIVYKFHILENLQHEIILGKDFMTDYKAVIDFNDNTIKFDTSVKLTLLENASIKPGLSMTVTACPVDSNIIIPNGLNGIITNALDEMFPGIYVQDIACTVVDSQLGMILTNNSDEVINVKRGQIYAQFIPINTDQMTLNRYKNNKQCPQNDAYGMSIKAFNAFKAHRKQNSMFDTENDKHIKVIPNRDINRDNTCYSSNGRCHYQSKHDQKMKVKHRHSYTNEGTIMNLQEQNEPIRGTPIEKPNQPQSREKKVVYDKFNCAWINESIKDLDSMDEPTLIKPELDVTYFNISTSDATGNDRQILRNILRRNKTAFVDSSGKLGLNTEYPARIILKDNAQPTTVRPYRTPYHLIAEMDKIINDLVKNEVIEEIDHSFWQTPIFLTVKAKDKAKGELNYRLLQDLRMVNLAIKRVTFVAPVVANILDSVSRGHTNIMSALDLKSGFWQQTLHKDDRFVTAFRSHNGKMYQWRCTPMGSQSSPLSFQNMMENILRPVLHKGVEIYIDDAFIHTKNITTMFQKLEQVLQLMIKANVKLNARKCYFVNHKIDFLGFLITKDTIQITQKHLKAIKNYPKPHNVKTLRQFLGLVNFLRGFIKNHSTRLQSLYNLLKKDTKFIWDEHCVKEFLDIKNELLSEPVLFLPRLDKEFVVHTDASNIGLGATLSQQYPEGLRPVAYFSRTLRDYEKNYCSFDLELLSISQSVSHFHPYLVGKPFSIRTDAKSLCNLLVQQKTTSRRAMRWLESLQGYMFTVKHIAGKNNVLADALSRNPVSEDEKEHSEQEFVMTVKSEPKRQLKGFVNKTTRWISHYDGHIHFIKPEDPILPNNFPKCNCDDFKGLAHINISKHAELKVNKSSTQINKIISPEQPQNNKTNSAAALLKHSTGQSHITNQACTDNIAAETCLQQQQQKQQRQSHTVSKSPSHVSKLTSDIVGIDFQTEHDYYTKNYLNIDNPVRKHKLIQKTQESVQLNTLKLLNNIERDIDSKLFKSQTMPYLSAVLTRRQAAEQGQKDEQIRKQEIEMLVDLPVTHKHLIAPHLFNEKGELLDPNETTNEDILLDQSEEEEQLDEDFEQSKQAYKATDQNEIQNNEISDIEDEIDFDEDFYDEYNEQKMDEKGDLMQDNDLIMDPVETNEQAEDMQQNMQIPNDIDKMLQEQELEEQKYDNIAYPTPIKIKPSVKPVRDRLDMVKMMANIDKIWNSDDLGFTDIELKKAQRIDPITKNLIEFLEQGILPPKVRQQRFVLLREFCTFIDEGILYHITELPRKQHEIENELIIRIWLPRQLQLQAIKTVHFQAGHPGVYRTLALLRKLYIFPSMYTLCLRAILSCEICLLYKRTGNALQMPRQLTNAEPHLFAEIAIDFAGPMNLDKNNNRYVLTVIERLTRYKILIPTKNITSDIVIDKLNKCVFQYFGLPNSIVLDNASYFASDKFKNYMKALGIKLKFISVSHSQANPLAESSNRIFLYALRSLARNNPRSWSEHLHTVQLYLNNSILTGSNMTSQSLLTGKAAILPIDLQNRHPIQNLDNADHHIQNLLKSQIAGREIITKIHMQRALQEKQKYDKTLTRIKTILKPGTIVYWRLKRPTETHKNIKLLKQNVGPLICIDVSKKGAVTLKHLYSGILLKRPVNIRHLCSPKYFRGLRNIKDNNIHHMSPMDQIIFLGNQPVPK